LYPGDNGTVFGVTNTDPTCLTNQCSLLFETSIVSRIQDI